MVVVAAAAAARSIIRRDDLISGCSFIGAIMWAIVGSWKWHKRKVLLARREGQGGDGHVLESYPLSLDRSVPLRVTLDCPNRRISVFCVCV